MAFQPGQSGNPAGRPKGSVNKQLAMLREAVEKVLPLIVDRALAGDAEAQRLILERGLPKLKPIEVPMEFTLPEVGETSPARAILLQAAEGTLPLSCAREIVRELIPVAEQEQREIAASAQSAPAVPQSNAYLRSLYP